MATIGSQGGKITENGDILLPSGVIVMWSGTTVPNGWFICDGNNGTPNLVDRFIKGSSADLSNVGSTGGSKDAVAVSHTHTFIGDALGGHNHRSPILTNPTEVNDFTRYGTEVVDDPPTADGYISGSSAGSYERYYSLTNIISAGTPSGTISTDGVEGTGKNEPQFYVLAYIMKA